MTYLELVQSLLRQSGTVNSSALPATLAGAVGRVALAAEYVAEAYIDIQNAHRGWKWLQSEFTGQTVAGQRNYLATSFTDEGDGLPITRFSQWGFKDDYSDVGLSFFLTSGGVASEGSLRWRDWDYYYETYRRGTQANGKPQHYTVDRQNRLVFGPVPDDVYTVRGKYRKSVQRLAANGDIPEMPLDFHTLIKDVALIYLEGHDEGPGIPITRLRSIPNWSMLEAQQLPRVRLGGPLA